MKYFSLLCLLLASPLCLAHSKLHSLCKGIARSQNVQIPHTYSSNISQEQFESVFEKIKNLYPIPPEVKYFSFEADWKDPAADAYAFYGGDGKTYTSWGIWIGGGLARHEKMTLDALALVGCHEWGHFLGGLPAEPEPQMHYIGKISYEAQADYFGTLKCLRKLWQAEDNLSAIRGKDIPKTVQRLCEKQWLNSQNDKAICIRSSLASIALAEIFFVLDDFPNPGEFPEIEKPSADVVSQTDEGYPTSQCRLDTFFQGAICHVPWSSNLSFTSVTEGACNLAQNNQFGARPLCWFRPE